MHLTGCGNTLIGNAEPFGFAQDKPRATCVNPGGTPTTRKTLVVVAAVGSTQGRVSCPLAGGHKGRPYDHAALAA